MEVLLPLLAFLGVLGADSDPLPSRQAQLELALERAVMLHEASGEHSRADAGADQELALDLMHMEIETGYLEKTCVCDDEAVTQMRLMIAYVGLLRLIGESDAEIEDRLVARAGENSGRVEQFLRFAGLDGIDHFICADFMARALAAGMTAGELHAYIDGIAPPIAAGGVQVAASH